MVQTIDTAVETVASMIASIIALPMPIFIQSSAPDWAAAKAAFNATNAALASTLRDNIDACFRYAVMCLPPLYLGQAPQFLSAYWRHGCGANKE